MIPVHRSSDSAITRTLVCACLLSALFGCLCSRPTHAAQPVLDLRYAFRSGETWHEKAVLQIDIRDLAGKTVSSSRIESLERVSVTSASARGAVLKRTPVAEGASSPSFTVNISDKGVYKIPEDAPEKVSRDRALVTMISQHLATLPESAIALNRTRTRRRVCNWPNGRLDVLENVTLASVENTGGSRVAVLQFATRAEPATALVTQDALAAPDPDALTAHAGKTTAVVDVQGVSGTGELKMDATTGRLIKYAKSETVGLSTTVGKTTLQRTVELKFTLTRIENLPRK